MRTEGGCSLDIFLGNFSGKKRESLKMASDSSHLFPVLHGGSLSKRVRWIADERICAILRNRADFRSVKTQTSVEYHTGFAYPAEFDLNLFLLYLTQLSIMCLIILNQTRTCI